MLRFDYTSSFKMYCPRCRKDVGSARSCAQCGSPTVDTDVLAQGLSSAASASETAQLTSLGLDAATTFTPPSDGATTFTPPLDASTTFAPPPTSEAAGDLTVLPLPREPTAKIDAKTSFVVPSHITGGERAVTPPAGGTVIGGDGGPLEQGQAFGPRYHIIRLLGIGGMGAVYQAWDGELGVSVAIKVIRPEISADPTASAEVERRFKRELLLARQVTHKNVVRIHDLGEIDGIKYITMPYVDGADLATILQREGRLPTARALRIARGIASGLVAAQNAGVIHRDLKPANIMVETDDEPMIMDFGIARSTGGPVADQASGQAGGPARRPLSSSRALAENTTFGAVVGTVEYMAPEQAMAKPIDQRADIYSFGLIVYDMLVGRRRSQRAQSAIAELQARLLQAPPAMKTIVPEIPVPLDALVSRCLDPDPANRYQTADELLAAFDRLDENGELIPIRRVMGLPLVAAVVSLLLALTGGVWWYARHSVPAPAHEPVSVLIADFENSTDDPAFDGTLEHALTTSIEGASFITAYSREDALRLARNTRVGDRLDETVSRLIAVRQGIKVIVTGAVAREGSVYRVTVRAIDPSAEPGQVKPLASESIVARKKEEVLKTVAALAGRLRGVLGDTTPESARLGLAETATTASLEALQAYTQASKLKKANRSDEAMAAYQRAVSLDPAFGLAYAGMGDLYMILKDEAKAKTAFNEALKHVDRMTEREKYRAYGNYYLNIARNNEKAIESYETFVKLYPADDGGHGNLGLAYLYSGNLSGAITQVREALRIYPKNALQRYNYAMYSMYATDFDTASTEAARTLKEAPSFSYAYLPIALSAAARGDLAGATETYEKLQQSGPEGALRAQLGLADLEMYRGRYRQAVNLLQDGIAGALKDNARGILAQEYVALAQAYLALGQKPRAADAALKATSYGTHESVLVPTARVLLAVGRTDEAKNIAQTLEKMLQTQTIAYSRLITAEIALQQGRYVDAIEGFNDSIKRRDTWLGRYLRGRAHVETQHFTEAMDDLGRCVTRRGEATDVFVYDTPTLRYLPPTYYWLARAQQAMHVVDANKNYEQFLVLTAAADPPDPLAADARRRLAAK